MAPRLLRSCFRSRGGSSESAVTAEADDHHKHRGSAAGPVVVELFSSQGCAESSSAEAVFSRLGRGDFREQVEAPLVLLGYHVDYWDYMGWKDTFGSSQWTVRQKAYVEALSLDTMFTPQVVVQGRAHCLANDPDAILACISAAPRAPQPALQGSFQRPSPDTLQVSITGSLKSKADHEGMYVMVALYECGLVTNCTSGANDGKVLANDYVVRRMEKLCSVKDMRTKKTASCTVSFGLWEGFNPAKCGVAVFVENSSHHIFGAQNFQLPDKL